MHAQSPLSDDQKKRFRTLKYYSPSLDYVVIAEGEILQTEEKIIIPTSKEGVNQEYTKLARVKFEIKGEECEISIYKAIGQDYLFVPFRDETSGKETYGAGRYVEIEHQIVDNKIKVKIDFNECYNPYCAYNAKWTCPLTPGENILKCKIEAGEKIYPDAEY